MVSRTLPCRILVRIFKAFNHRVNFEQWVAFTAGVATPDV